jgi:hypothetical protein
MANDTIDKPSQLTRATVEPGHFTTILVNMEEEKTFTNIF